MTVGEAVAAQGTHHAPGTGTLVVCQATITDDGPHRLRVEAPPGAPRLCDARLADHKAVRMTVGLEGAGKGAAEWLDRDYGDEAPSA